MRECRGCGKVQPLNCYANPPSKRSCGGAKTCNTCRNDYMRRYRTKNPERQLNKDRRSKFKIKYGITLEQYTQMLVEQDHCCACCGSETPGSRVKHFSVDHCHDTGKVRGLLCDKCNRGLGMLGDTLDSLLRAVQYLQRNG